MTARTEAVKVVRSVCQKAPSAIRCIMTNNYTPPVDGDLVVRKHLAP